jgi:hypothetical protein
VTHVFTFRRVPPGGEVETWIAEFAPGAVLRYGGGLQVVLRDDPLALHFKVYWSPRYSAHHITLHEQEPNYDAF